MATKAKKKGKHTIKFKGIEFEEVSKSDWNDSEEKNFLAYKINGTEHYFISEKKKGQVVKK